MLLVFSPAAHCMGSVWPCETISWPSISGAVLVQHARCTCAACCKFGGSHAQWRLIWPAALRCIGPPVEAAFLVQGAGRILSGTPLHLREPQPSAARGAAPERLRPPAARQRCAENPHLPHVNISWAFPTSMSLPQFTCRAVHHLSVVNVARKPVPRQCACRGHPRFPVIAIPEPWHAHCLRPAVSCPHVEWKVG